MYQIVGSTPLTWLDPLGLDRLVFDGKKICRVTDDGETCIKCWKARSGKPLSVDENGEPAFETDTTKQDEGPIPEGEWTLHSRRNKKGDDSKGIWNREEFNRHQWVWNDIDSGPWGEHFSRLSPGYGGQANDTNGRHSFNIHGGSNWGSAGCIDLKCGDPDFFKEVMKDAGGKDVRLTVDYSGKSMPKDCEEPRDCGKPWENRGEE